MNETIRLINMGNFPLVSRFLGASFNYHKPNTCFCDFSNNFQCFLFLKASQVCEQNQKSSGENTFSKFSHIHTALLNTINRNVHFNFNATYFSVLADQTLPLKKNSIYSNNYSGPMHFLGNFLFQILQKEYCATYLITLNQLKNVHCSYSKIADTVQS